MRQIDFDHSDSLSQGQAGTPRAYRTGRHWHPRALACRIGDDTELNKFRRPHRCAVCPRGAGLALAERVGVIEIDLPEGVRVRVDSSVNEKALRRVLSALRGAG